MLSSLLALFLAAPLLAEPGEGVPNVVIFFTDDQGWADLGCYGARDLATPNIDRLASEGVRFTDFYVSQPVCSASRTSLLTGCYANRLGIHGALGPAATNGIRPGETTLAELLRSKGHATAVFGKWHLGHHLEFLPTRNGFDRFWGIPYSNDMWPYHPEYTKPWHDLPTFENERVLEYNGDQAQFTTEITRRAVAFVEECAATERPFFLFVAHPMPHVPLAVSERHAGRSERGIHGDVIEEIDASVGEVVGAIDAAGLGRKTLVIFASDNGPWLSYGDHAGGVGPLREGKGTTFDGGVRVPFIARFPGRIPAGSVCSEPAMTIDLLPTIAGLVDSPLPEHPIDGLDIWPLISGEPGASSPHEAYYFWYGRGEELQAMRAGRHKLHFPHGYRSMRRRELGRAGSPGKYDYSLRTGLELYDLEDDIGESIDLAAERPEVVARLSKLADRMRVRLGDSLTGVVAKELRLPPLHVDTAESPTLPASPAELRLSLEALTRIPDSEPRAAATDAFFALLAEADALPLRTSESVVFIHRGTARSVGVAGDFNRWNPFAGALESWAPLDLWTREESIPSDARLDYRFVLDGREWITDALNPYRTSAFRAELSELRMPGWRPSPWVAEREGVAYGALSKSRIIESEALGCKMSYRVHTPAGVSAGARLPVLYALDGEVCVDPEHGALTRVIDNLIAEGRIPPVLTVLINAHVSAAEKRPQRRFSHYPANPQYTAFLNEELIPAIDAAAPTDPRRGARAVLGVGLGGLAAAAAVLEEGSPLGAAALLSPPLAVGGEELAARWRESPPGGPADLTRIFLSSGSFGDVESQLRPLAALLGRGEALGWSHRLVVVPESPSWGQWRGLLDEAVIYLFAE